MATEEQAHRAREVYSDYLRNSGAHAITVDKIDGETKDNFAVIAFYEEEPSSPVPEFLEIELGGRSTRVPLISTISDRGRLE